MSLTRSAVLKPLVRLTRPGHAESGPSARRRRSAGSASRPASRKEYLWLAAIGAVLISALVAVRANSQSITGYIDQNPVEGVCLFLFLNILDAVIAPGATLPLIPVAAHAWGRVPAALVTTTGWTAGSLVAFSIARRWGAPLVKRLTSMDRLRQMKRYIPEDVFWTVTILRLVMPMDVLSYLLGLFTDISWIRYTAATAIGVTPPAFVLAYLGKLSHAYEIIAFGIAGVLLTAYLTVARRRRRRAAERG